MTKLLIGTWNESEAREIQRGTSYAADYINHVTVPGLYDVYLFIERSRNYDTGVEHVTAKSLSITVNTYITDGKYFSGFGGNNFASRDAETGPSTIHINPYAYHARDLVNDGTLTLDPEFAFLADPIGLEFTDYLEQKRVGLYRHFDLDPYAYAKTGEFAEKLAELVDAINTGNDWKGWDLPTINTAYKLKYIFYGSDPKIELTFQGKQFIEEHVG
jgi:hypothetical protein